jgi:hypothetical protein
MILKSFLAAIGLTFALGASAAPIVNGDFEAGLAGWTKSGNVDLATQAGGAFWFGAGSNAQNGNYAIAFNAGDTTPDALLWQTFATVEGAHYTVTFNYGATNCQFSCGQSLTAEILGADTASLANFSADGQSGGLLGSYTFHFIADGDQATVQFSDFNGNDTVWLDGVLDNVVVANDEPTDVPEPAPLALFAAALLGLGVAKRRKN